MTRNCRRMPQFGGAFEIRFAQSRPHSPPQVFRRALDRYIQVTQDEEVLSVEDALIGTPVDAGAHLDIGEVGDDRRKLHAETGGPLVVPGTAGSALVSHDPS